MLEIYGHPFSSYTWKAQIALHALGREYDFRTLDQDHPENGVFVAERGGPQGLFPVLADGDRVVFEASAIIEYLDEREQRLIPSASATDVRMMDRVFDNYVMNVMQGGVAEAIRHPGNPDPAVLADVGARLRRTYAWLERWLAGYARPDGVTKIECAAAPSLFYADWVEHIGDEYPRLQAWRAHLNALPEVSRCIEAARPFRAYFPLGAPDRD